MLALLTLTNCCTPGRNAGATTLNTIYYVIKKMPHVRRYLLLFLLLFIYYFFYYYYYYDDNEEEEEEKEIENIEEEKECNIIPVKQIQYIENKYTNSIRCIQNT